VLRRVGHTSAGAGVERFRSKDQNQFSGPDELRHRSA
jgi:hypothetical protein